jgi:hypothetical protein
LVNSYGNNAGEDNRANHGSGSALQTTKFKGDCSNCGNAGHRASECEMPKRITRTFRERKNWDIQKWRKPVCWNQEKRSEVERPKMRFPLSVGGQPEESVEKTQAGRKVTWHYARVCTDHCTNDKTIFSEFKEVKEILYTAKRGVNMVVLGIGCVTFTQ